MRSGPGAVGEAVGGAVLLARDVDDLERVEGAGQAPGLLVEGLQLGIADLVLAQELADQELGIRADCDRLRS